MAITVYAQDAAAVLATVKKQITENKIRTWEVDKDGDFTHSPPQWKNQAWLRPKVLRDQLVLNILISKKIQNVSEIYAVYHGRFIEMLLEHVRNQFQSASASAKPETGDVV